MTWWYVVSCDEGPYADDPYLVEVGPFSQRHEAEASRAHERPPFATTPPYERER